MPLKPLVRQSRSFLPRSGVQKVPLRGASRPVTKPQLGPRVRVLALRLLKYLTGPVLMACLGFAVYLGGQYLLPYVDRPIAKVGVEGAIDDVGRRAIQQQLAPFVQTRFFEVDLDAIRNELENMPLVANAQVHRVWPDQVEVVLQMEMPIARWGDATLLNSKAQTLVPKDLSPYQKLPQLRGPQGAEQRVMEQYHMLSQLLRPHGFGIAELDLHDRGSWFLMTESNANGPGFEISLGGDQLVEKLQRFISIYEKALRGQISNVKSIDLRYANGLAVAWREPELKTAEKAVNVH